NRRERTVPCLPRNHRSSLCSYDLAHKSAVVVPTLIPVCIPMDQVDATTKHGLDSCVDREIGGAARLPVRFPQAPEPTGGGLRTGRRGGRLYLWRGSCHGRR